MGGYGRYIRRIGAVAAAAILLWAVIFGLALRGANEQTKTMLGDISEALKKSMLEFKKAGDLDNVTSAELSKEEIAFIEEFCRNNIAKDYYDHYFNDFQKRLMAYKKTLMQG